MTLSADYDLGSKSQVKPGPLLRLVVAFGAALQILNLVAQESRPDDSQPTPRAAERTYRGPFDPEHRNVAQAESKEILVSLKRRESCQNCSSIYAFVFQAKNKSTGATTEFRIDEMPQIDEIHVITPSRAAVIGRILANTSMINVVDLKTGRVLDSIWCFRPSVSPDKRFVAYVKVYPAHFVEGTSDEFLLYDLTALAEDNRPRPIRGVPNSIDVGIPVFPEGSNNSPNDNILTSRELAHHMSDFFWLDRTTVAALDSWRGLQRLVIVDVRAGPRLSKVLVKPLNTSQLLDPSECKELSEQLFSERPEHLLRVSTIRRAKNAASVYVDFTAANPACLRQTSLAVPIP